MIDDAEALLRDAAWLRHLVGHLVREPADADDVVQEIDLLALQQPEPLTAPRAWLATVARRVVGRVRARARLGREREHAAARSESQPSAHDVVARAESFRLVVEAVLALDEPYRTAVLLRFFEGRKTRAIAAALGCPVATVRSRLARGLALLRGRLERVLGPRRGWAAVFGLSLGGNTIAAGTAAAGTGAMAMGASEKVVAGAAGLLVVGAMVLVTLGGAGDAADAPEVEPAPAAMQAAANDAPPPEPAMVQAAAKPAPGSRAVPARSPAPNPGATKGRSTRSADVDPPGEGVLAVVFDAAGAGQEKASIWVGGSVVLVRANDEEGTSASRWRLADGPKGARPRLAGTTDRNGKCRLALDADTTLIATTTRGEISAALTWSRQEPLDVLAFVVQPGFALHGRVVDHPARPAPEAVVEVISGGQSTVPVDRGGRFLCLLPTPGSYGVMARQGDHWSDCERIDAIAGRLRDLTLRLRPPRFVSGTVLDPYGMPCALATVRALRGTPGEPDVWRLAAGGTAQTDAQGRYRVELHDDGVFELSASHPEFAPSPVTRVVIQEKASAAREELRLGLWRAMLGEVRWSDGAPVVGAEVAVVPVGAHRAPRAEVAKASVGGNALYEVPRLLPDALYDVTCTPDPTRPGTRTVRQGVPASVQSFTFDAAQVRGASVRLALRPPDGRAMPRAAKVFLHRQGARNVPVPRDGAAIAVDGDGRVVVDRLERGATYLMVVECVGYARTAAPPFTAGTDEEVAVELQPGVRLEVAVVWPGRRPARGQLVVATPQDSGLASQAMTARADRSGVAVFADLLPGTWVVYTVAPGGRERTRQVMLRPGGTVEVELVAH